MNQATSPKTIAQTFWPIKSSETSSIDGTPNSMIHYKVSLSRNKKLIVKYSDYREKPYGVSSFHKILTKGLLIKKWDTIRAFLTDVCNLTTKQRDVALQLLRLQAYYPQVYPKAAQVAEGSNVGIATFWRTVKRLRDLNLLKVVNRFVIRPEAQISNEYLLKELLIVLARYLAEHGVHFWEKWLKPILAMPGQQFWSQIYRGPGGRVVPWRLAAEDL